MRKTIKSMVIGTLTAVMLASGASAADFTSSADALKDLGLFSGSQSGYELDRAPDRAEAATMLVRLLGKEAEAKTYFEANAAKFPFQDMNGTYEWAKPYVAWLQSQGLTSGATPTTFEPGNPCTAQQYTTFLMRALGYSDAAGGDFTYANAIDFATQKGVVDAFNMDQDNFLRDEVVALSYTALSAAPKSGEKDLLTKLVADKAIPAEKAAPVQKTFEALRNFNKECEAIAATTSTDATADFTMHMKVANEAVDATGKFTMQVKADPAKLNEMSMAMKGTMTMGVPGADGKIQKVDMPIEMYVKDGFSYTKVMDQKVKQDLNLENTFQGLDLQSLTGMKTIPLCMVSSISQEGSTYKMSYNADVFNDMFAKIFEQASSQIEITEEMKQQNITADMFKMIVNLTKADIEMTLKEGGLYSQKADMAMQMEMLGQKIDASIVINVTANKVGDAVTVDFPTDLDSYKTLEEQIATELSEYKTETSETASIKAENNTKVSA